MYELTIVFRANQLDCNEKRGEITYAGIKDIVTAERILKTFLDDNPVYTICAANIYRKTKSITEGVPDDAF
jgi:hypothetical protein